MNRTRRLLKEINTLFRHFGALVIDIEATNKYNIRSLDLVSSYNLGLWGYYDNYFFITFVFQVPRALCLVTNLFSGEDPILINHLSLNLNQHITSCKLSIF